MNSEVLETMANAIHGVLQGMDSIANAPASLAVRLRQPALLRQRPQGAADLTPPKVVRRKRRLTLPLDATASEVSGKAKWFRKPVQQRTSEQLQSPLIRLPAELREEIWRYVILGNTDRYHGMGDGGIEIRWRSTGSGRGRASAFRVSFVKDREQWGLGVLGMLCSCRIIYSEAISLLYSLPTFSFRNQNVETFLAFIGATLPHRRDQIRFLDLRWLGVSKSLDNYQSPEYRAYTYWSYTRIRNIKALSQLPDAAAVQAEQDLVRSEWVVNEILEDMKGIKRGGVNWGSASIGCFVQN